MAAELGSPPTGARLRATIAGIRDRLRRLSGDWRSSSLSGIPFFRSTLFLLGLGSGAALLAFALLGSSMRYSGDDYCYGAALARHGFFGLQLTSFVSSMPYSGNRFSLTLMHSAADLFPPVAMGALTGLALALWGAALAAFLGSAATRWRIGLGRTAKWSLAALLVFLTAYQAPDLEQTVYWRSGMLPYLAPLIGQTFLASVLLKEKQRSSAWSGAWLGAFALALLSGGFSETTAAIQVTWLAILASIRLARRRREDGLGRVPVALSASLVGSVLAAALLLVSPSNIAHWAILPERLPFLSTLNLTFRCPMSFFVGSLRGNPVPTLVTLACTAILGSFLRRPAEEPGGAAVRVLFLRVALTIAGAYLLVAASCAPSIVAQATYPGLRALLPARYVMVLGLAWIGFTFGASLRFGRTRFPVAWRWGGFAASAILVLGGVYGVRAAAMIADGYPRYRDWARQWDARDAEIRRQRLLGEMDVHIPAIDHIIPFVAELSDDPDTWYNQCAAEYYRVTTIRTTPVGTGSSGVGYARTRACFFEGEPGS